MALASASPLAAFDQANAVFLDLSDVLAEMIRKDNTAFLSRIGLNGEATQIEHKWVEDSLNANTATAAEAIDNSETAIDVASGHGTRFRIGTTFRVERAGSTEVIQVTAISGDTLTVVRGYGSTSAEDHGSTTDHTLKIIAHTNQSGADMPADASKARSSVGNYCQIFQYGINIAHDLRAVLTAGVADEFSLQVARRLMEAQRELDSSIVAGIKSASAGSDSVYRSMAGLIEFVSQSGGNTNTTSEALTLSVVNGMAKSIWDDGGVPNFILVGGKQKRAISSFDQSARRSVYDSNVAGYVVDRVLTDLGFFLDVIVDPFVPDDVAVVGDTNKVKAMPLRNSAMRVEDIAKTGASTKSQIYGDYTLEVRNALESFAYHNSLT